MIDIAIRAAIQAGLEILKIYNNPKADFSIERKADNSPLTIADKASHRIIETMLQKTNIPLLSEEGKNIPYEKRKHWTKFWMVDPLDGTKEFIKRNGEFTVNIALIRNGKPAMGVIYVPVAHALYVGIENTGAWKIETDDARCDLSFVRAKGQGLPFHTFNRAYKIVGSRSHMSYETGEYIKELEKVHSSVEIVSKGSSLKICMVAEGSASEYPRFGPTMEWDTAAGHAIANAAGKKLWHTDFRRELTYNKENLLNPYFIVK